MIGGKVLLKTWGCAKVVNKGGVFEILIKGFLVAKVGCMSQE